MNVNIFLCYDRKDQSIPIQGVLISTDSWPSNLPGHNMAYYLIGSNLSYDEATKIELGINRYLSTITNNDPREVRENLKTLVPKIQRFYNTKITKENKNLCILLEYRFPHKEIDFKIGDYDFFDSKLGLNTNSRYFEIGIIKGLDYLSALKKAEQMIHHLNNFVCKEKLKEKLDEHLRGSNFFSTPTIIKELVDFFASNIDNLDVSTDMTTDNPRDEFVFRGNKWMIIIPAISVLGLYIICNLKWK